MKIDFRDIRQTDIEQVVIAYMEIFEGKFLSEMGPDFLKIFLLQFLGEKNYAVGVFSEDQCIGFAIGTQNSSDLLSGFYRTNFLKVVFIMLKRVVLSKFIRKGLLQRVMHIPIALTSFFRKKNSEIILTNHVVISSLMGFGVLPSVRGTGLADELLQEWLLRVQYNNLKCARLSVNKDNKRAIKFYENNNWLLYEDLEESLVLERCLE